MERLELVRMQYLLKRNWLVFLGRLAVVYGVLLLGGGAWGESLAGDAKVRALKTPAACWAALKEEQDTVVRRMAFRKLLYGEGTGEEAIKAGLQDGDAGIRRVALYELFMRDRKSAIPVMEAMVGDKSMEVGVLLAELGRFIEPKEASVAFMKALQEKNENMEVRRAVSKYIGFGFFREVQLYSSNPANDHEVTVLEVVQLPLDGWRFMKDAEEAGHRDELGYYQPGLNERKWKSIKIGECWENVGVPGYDGIGWYRLHVKLPAKPTGTLASELCFGAVDEAAWCWVNGQYVGQHDEGLGGWNKPFRLDVTEALKWGEENVIVVRVEDTSQGGGIWKPVHIEALK